MVKTLKIDRIIWDEWNVEHVARHGVVPHEVVEILHGEHVAKESYRERLKVVGETRSGRILAIAIHEDSENEYYVITARDADLGERGDYLREKEGQYEKE